MKEGDEKLCCKSYNPAEAIMVSEAPTAMKSDVSNSIECHCDAWRLRPALSHRLNKEDDG